jgi:hypothetical protein
MKYPGNPNEIAYEYLGIPHEIAYEIAYEISWHPK